MGRDRHRNPEVDIYEAGNDYIIEMDLPGHSREHVETKLNGNELLIVSRPPKRTHDFHINERSLGRQEVNRKLYLPGNADSGKINAALTNGVLKIVIPKSLATTLPTTSTGTSSVVLPTSSSTTALVHPQTVVTTDTTKTVTETHRA